MTPQFQPGQEVEVLTLVPTRDEGLYLNWHKAKIFRNREKSGHLASDYEVEFPDGTHAVFDADHIRELVR